MENPFIFLFFFVSLHIKDLAAKQKVWTEGTPKWFEYEVIPLHSHDYSDKNIRKWLGFGESFGSFIFFLYLPFGKKKSDV